MGPRSLVQGPYCEPTHGKVRLLKTKGVSVHKTSKIPLPSMTEGPRVALSYGTLSGCIRNRQWCLISSAGVLLLSSVSSSAIDQPVGETDLLCQGLLPVFRCGPKTGSCAMRMYGKSSTAAFSSSRPMSMQRGGGKRVRGKVSSDSSEGWCRWDDSHSSARHFRRHGEQGNIIEFTYANREAKKVKAIAGWSEGLPWLCKLLQVVHS